MLLVDATGFCLLIVVNMVHRCTATASSEEQLNRKRCVSYYLGTHTRWTFKFALVCAPKLWHRVATSFIFSLP